MNHQFPLSCRRPAYQIDPLRAWEIIDGIRAETKARVDAYEARGAARVERLEKAATRAEDRSRAHYAASNAIVDRIPMGQPILIGHHSEKGHRRDLERSHRHMDKFCEEHRNAKELAARAQAAEDNDAIRGDDPLALAKLREKLKGLETMQANMKGVNRAHKAFLKDPASLDKSTLPEIVRDRIRSYQPRYSWEPHPIAPYQLSNNNANIKRVKDRIEQLSKARSKGGQEDRTALDGTVRIVDDAEADRLRVYFPGKPDEAMRKQLKSQGFRWSPTAGCWQAYRGNRSEFALRVLFPELNRP